VPPQELGQAIWPFLAQLALVLARLGAALLVAPVFGDRVVPLRVRVGVTVVCGLSFALALPPGPVLGPDAMLLALALELMSGLVIGVAFAMVLSTVLVSGEIIATELGFSMATLVDPLLGHRSTVVARFLRFLGLIIFLSVDGHLVVLAAVGHSFGRSPVGAAGGALGSGAATAVVVELGSRAISVGAAIGIPIIGMMFAMTSALGAMAKAAPQINLFAESFPARAVLGIAALSVSLGAVGPGLLRVLRAAVLRLG